MNLSGNYVIYQNQPHRRFVIHAVDCSNVGKHGGVSRSYPPNSWYIGPFDTVRQAQWKVDADRDGWTQGSCSRCGA